MYNPPRHEPPRRSATASSGLSWSTTLALIAAFVLILVGVIVLLERTETAEPEVPTEKPSAAEVRRERLAMPSSKDEVAQLRQKLEELESARQQEEKERAEATAMAKEVLSELLEAKRPPVEEDTGTVDVSSGPFTKVSTGVAQITFSLSNTRRTWSRLPLKVTLFRDGQEAGSKTIVAEIGPREERAYSVLIPAGGTGSWAASVEALSP